MLIPKFRCWVAGKMWQVYSLVLDKENGLTRVNVGEGGCLGFPLKRVKLMQFTGLKDKNGKEIYSGDIIQQTIDEEADLGFGLGIENCEVVWVQSKQAIYGDECIVTGWFVKTKVFNNGKDCEYLPIERTSHPIIIGSIYQNKELLT